MLPSLRFPGVFVACALIFVFCHPTALSKTRQTRAAHTRHALESPEPTDEFGPEMTAFLGFLDSEEAELQHLYDVGEVPEDDYRLSADRLATMRIAALRLAKSRDEDFRPDLYVLIAGELTQIFQNGVEALKGKRTGDVVEENWIYHGKIRHGSVFFVLERVGSFQKNKPL